MGAIHELREEYRHYRVDNPGYRWLFLLLDLIVLLLKLALFGGFVLLCWYLISRSPNAEQSGLIGSKAPVVEEVVVEQAPEISEERLARLREIAGQEVSQDTAQNTSDDNTAALVGNVTAPEARTVSNESPSNPDSSFVVANFAEATPAITEVQVESVASEPAATNPDAAFTENVHIPSDTENGVWVLKQSADGHTIQLALTVNVEFLEDFARKLPDEHVAAIYPERVNDSGNIQYSLSLGSFATKSGAETALAALDENLKRYGAHTRTFDEVHGNIAGFVR